MFYNYRPDRADKWCWRGVRPSGRQKGIVLAEVKMENIKRYSTDDCNLTKPLQGYLTRHIKQGEGFLESKTMTMWLSSGSISVFLFLALIITHKACQRDNKIRVLRSAGRRISESISRKKKKKYGIPTAGAGVTLQLFQPISTIDVPWTRHAQPAPVDLLRGRKMPNQKGGTYLPPQLPRDRKEKLLCQPTSPAYKRG